MGNLELLKEAIEKRIPISFQYNKAGKTRGVRIGNPHAVFVMRKLDGTNSTKVHIVQSGGVSDSRQDFPSFRMFDILELGAIELMISDSPFDIGDGYNPTWEGYKFVISKV